MNSEALTTNITHFMNAQLAGESHFLVGVRVSADLRRVTVLLDGDNGVDVDFCARMSREIGEQLEGLEEVPAYVLEVSSPGADAPMKLFRQYPKHIGRTLSVRLKEREDEVKGRLLEVRDQQIHLEETGTGRSKKKPADTPPDGIQVIPFSTIEYARVVVQL